MADEVMVLKNNTEKLIHVLKKHNNEASPSVLEKELGMTSENLRKTVSRARAAGHKITNIRLALGKGSIYKLTSDDKKAQNIEDAIASAVGGLDTSVFKTPDAAIEEGGQVVPEEVFVACLADLHYGKKTRSYSPEDAIERLKVWEDAVVSLVGLHRHYAPINKLVIPLLGDIIDGEEIYRGHGYEVEFGVLQQMAEVGKELAGIFQRLSVIFEKIEILCVPGNHGRGQWKGSAKTNWDSVVYILLDALLSQNKRIECIFPNHTDYILHHTIMNHGFLCVHGHQVKMWQNIPWYGLTNKAMRWQGSIGSFEYMISGHFHTCNAGVDWNDIEILNTGTAVSGDDFAVEQLGMRSSVKALFFGVNEKYGVSWRYKIRLN